VKIKSARENSRDSRKKLRRRHKETRRRKPSKTRFASRRKERSVRSNSAESRLRHYSEAWLLPIKLMKRKRVVDQPPTSRTSWKKKLLCHKSRLKKNKESVQNAKHRTRT